MIDTFGYAVQAPRGRLSPFRFQRRSPREHDILIEVLQCRICHSDPVVANEAFGRTPFALVPGHEIVERGDGKYRFVIDLATLSA